MTYHSIFATKPKLNIQDFTMYFYPNMAENVQEIRSVKSDGESDPNKELDSRMQKSMTEPSSISVKTKLNEMENILKIKLQNNFSNVKVAFLKLDSDQDGYITS